MICRQGFAADHYVAKLNVASPPNDPQAIALTKFGDLVRQRTNGVVDIQVFPSNELGTDAQSLDDMKIGVIEATCVPSSQYIQYAPDFRVCDAPFLFRDQAHAQQAIPTLLDALSPNLIKVGIDPLVGFAFGSHDMCATFGVHKLADMSGKKIRTIESPIALKTWKLLGANPTPIPSQEVYMALQTGIVDSVDTSAASYVSFKRYEVAKHFARVGTAQYFQIVSFASAWLKKLPKDQLDILRSTAGEYAKNFFDMLHQGELDALAMAGKLGFQVETIEDRDAWVAATAPARDDVAASSPSAKDLIDKIGKLS
jgi:TRAP-type C4-dicarboxylate transport system substrate-binding protein